MSVWKFPTADGAAAAEATLKDLQRRELIQIHDAAIVTYPEGAKKPKTKQLTGLAAAGALGGAFWGMLFGLIFFIPLLGLAIGAGMGALFGHFGAKGIDKAFQEQVRDYVKPGTSALFMVIDQVTPDKAIAALRQYGGTVIRTSLSDEDTKKLQEALTPSAPVA